MDKHSKDDLTSYYSISRKCLFFETDYTWKSTPGDDPKISGEPDRSLLNREEGYEILAFINIFLKEHTNLYKDQESALKVAHKVERMILKASKAHRSREKVQEWIEDNWEEYK